ncbi:MAG: hypothetical protein R2839_03735 [Thermomicrobiales bacterium]
MALISFSHRLVILLALLLALGLASPVAADESESPPETTESTEQPNSVSGETSSPSDEQDQAPTVAQSPEGEPAATTSEANTVEPAEAPQVPDGSETTLTTQDAPVGAADQTCEPGVQVVHRDVTLYYGTLRDDANVPVQDGVSLSDHIVAGLATQIQNSQADPRARTGLDAWTIEQSAPDWVQGTPEGLDARAGLLALYAGVAGGNVVPDAELDQGSIDFVLESTHQNCGDGVGELQTDFVGRVHFIELNAAVEPPACETERFFVREMTIYYGTITKLGGDSANGLQLTDHIEGGVRLRLEQDPSVDPRVIEGIAVWNTLNQSSVDWVVNGTPEGLNAQQALLDQFAVFATSQDGVSMPAPAIDHGSVDYEMQSFLTEEECGGEAVDVLNRFFARITFIELNATVARDDDTGPPPDDDNGGPPPEEPANSAAGGSVSLPNTGAGATSTASGARGWAILLLALLSLTACRAVRRLPESPGEAAKAGA